MAERIEGFTIGIDLDTLRVERGLSGLKDRLRTVNSEMRKNMSSFDYGEKSLDKYQSKMDGLNKKLEVQKQITAEAKKEYEKMDGTVECKYSAHIAHGNKEQTDSAAQTKQGQPIVFQYSPIHFQ